MKTAEEILEMFILRMIDDKKIRDRFASLEIMKKYPEWEYCKNAIVFAQNQALEDLKGIEIIDPRLVSDGHGEYPSGYVITEKNVEQIKKQLKK